MLALSTCWQSPIALSGRDLIARLSELGFSSVELEYRVTEAMFTEIVPALEAHKVRPVSIHNYFPKPDVVLQPGSELWAFTSEDPMERETAVKYTKKAIEIAGGLGAQAVVLHCGQVPVDPRMDDLKYLFDAGQIEEAPGKRLIGEIKKEREAKIKAALNRVMDCLDPLAGLAERTGVKLGLENRYHPHEIPDSRDLDTLLSAFGNGTVGYWHDVGHAAVQENLGLDSQVSLLGRYRDRMIGVHLHDAAGYSDHLAPGRGEVDFAFIGENLPRDVVQVLELGSQVTPAQLLQAVDVLAKAGIA